MRKLAQRAFLILLVTVLLVNLAPPGKVFGENSDLPTAKTIAVIDSSGVVKSVQSYSFDGTVMMKADDLAAYTRCTLDVSGQTYSFLHAGGLVQLNVNADTGAVTDNNGGDAQSLLCKMIDGSLYIDAYPILTYFGASCAVDQGKGLVGIFMPQETFYEALEFWVNSGQDLTYYSIADNKNATIFLDQMVLLIVNEHLLPSDAIFSALELDPTDYDSARQARNDRATIQADQVEAFKSALGMGSDIMSAAAFANYSDVATQFLKNAAQCTDTAQLNTMLAAYQSAFDNSQALTNAVDNVSASVDVLSLGIDIFTATNDRLSITTDTRNAFTDTFSKDTLKAAGVSDLRGDYRAGADAVSLAITSDATLTAETVFEKSLELAGDKLALAPLASLGGIVTASVEIGIEVSKLAAQIPGAQYTPFSMPDQATVELKAIYTAEYYEKAREVFYGLTDKCSAAQWHDVNALQKLRGSYLVMLRFLLVNYESNVEYGGYHNWFNRYSAKIDQCKQTADQIAKALDDAESSTVAALPTLSVLKSADADFSAQVLAMGAYVAPEETAAPDSNTGLPAFPTVDTSTDDIKIVDVSPSTFPAYGQDTHFVVTIDYSLQSTDSGIVYLGFNTEEKDSFTLVDDNLKVTKGSGRITLEATVQPAEYGTPNQGVQGGLDAVSPAFGGGPTAFQAYVNLSAYPHDDHWSPMADDTWELAQE